jgi:hypothetical protein
VFFFFWTAPAKRSGDGAFDWRKMSKSPVCSCQSGVALRLPPQSKTLRVGRASSHVCAFAVNPSEVLFLAANPFHIRQILRSAGSQFIP